MLLLDIYNNNLESDEIFTDNIINLKLKNKYENYHDKTNPIINYKLYNDQIISLNNIKICKFLGEGSYGKVFKIKINNNYYALKISENENPYKLKKRYESLVNCDKIEKYIIKIYIAGKINFETYKYFSIMEYGGSTIKNILPIESESVCSHILKQLYNVVHTSMKNKLLLTDFKLSNITIDNNFRIKLIDIYMECENYSPCINCRIVKTYSTLEIDKIKHIYEDDSYNYSCILIPLTVCLIDILCERSSSYYCEKLANKFNLKYNIKGMLPLIQIACFNYLNNDNNKLKYNKLLDYKNKTEEKYLIIKDEEFFKYFINNLKIKKIYSNIIKIEDLRIIIIDLINLDFDSRTISNLKKILK